MNHALISLPISGDSKQSEMEEQARDIVDYLNSGYHIISEVGNETVIIYVLRKD